MLIQAIMTAPVITVGPKTPVAEAAKKQRSKKVLAGVRPGSIILLHDGGGQTRPATRDALGPAIDYLKAEGYRFTFPVIGPQAQLKK